MVEAAKELAGKEVERSSHLRINICTSPIWEREGYSDGSDEEYQLLLKHNDLAWQQLEWVEAQQKPPVMWVRRQCHQLLYCLGLYC